MPKYEIKNLSGTLMVRNTPLVDFSFEDGLLVYCKQLNDNWNLFPIEFSKFKRFNTGLFNLFIESRITPPTRIGVNEVLTNAGIDHYNWDDMLRYNNGAACSDQNWIRYKSGPQTYEELLRKQGFEVVEKKDV